MNYNIKSLLCMLSIAGSLAPMMAYANMTYEKPFLKMRAPLGKCEAVVLTLYEDIPQAERESLVILGYCFDMNNPKNPLEVRGSGNFKDSSTLVIKYDDLGGANTAGEYRLVLVNKKHANDLSNVLDMPSYCSVQQLPAKYCSAITYMNKKVDFAPFYLKSKRKLTNTEKGIIAATAVTAVGLLAAGIIAAYYGQDLLKQKGGAKGSGLYNPEYAEQWSPPKVVLDRETGLPWRQY